MTRRAVALAAALLALALPAGAGETLTDSLQGQDGVRIQTMCTHCNSSNVQLGGLSRELVPILRDGFPLFGGLATSFVLSMLPPDTIAETEVTRGPGDAALPAPAAGGTIRLTGSRPDELPAFDVATTAGSWDERSLLARGSGALSRSVSASLVAGTTDVDPVDDDADGWNDVAAVDRVFADGQLRIEAARRHRVDLGISWIDEKNPFGRGGFDGGSYLTDYVDWMFGSGPPPQPAWTREDTEFRRAEYRAGWSWRIGDRSSLDVRLLGAARDQSVSSQITGDPASPFSAFFERFAIRESDRFASATWSRSLGARLRLSAGAESSREEVRAVSRSDPGAAPGAAAIDFVESDALNADLEWSPSTAWKLTLGARWDDQSWGAEDLDLRRSASDLLPRATLRYRPSAAWTLRLVGGRTSRAPRPIFAEVCCGQDYQRSYRADAETGTTWGVETIYQPSPDLRLSAYAARAEFDDYIVDLVGWSMLYVQTYSLVNLGSARADTAEVGLRWSPWRRLRLDGSLGWVSFFNTGERDVAITVTPPSFTQPYPGGVVRPVHRIPYQATRSASLGVSVDAGRDVRLSAQAGYTGPMLIQQYADDPFAGQENGSNLLLAALRETDPFWLLSASIDVPLGHGLALSLAVDNLADRVQNDLGDPTTDYNWGPLAGRAWRAALRYHLDR